MATDQFKFIRDTDKPNLDKLLGAFHDKGFRPRLNGPAASRSDYTTIDLALESGISHTPEILSALGATNVQKTEYRLGGEQIECSVHPTYTAELNGTKIKLSGFYLMLVPPGREAEFLAGTRPQNHPNMSNDEFMDQLSRYLRSSPPQPPLGGGSSGGPGIGTR